ncbi:hypothetical protein Vca1114GL_04905 [Vibrio campbellii]|nr:hypothetical protein Vca1114GL_04905 [Vibrio campbellii]
MDSTLAFLLVESLSKSGGKVAGKTLPIEGRSCYND